MLDHQVDLVGDFASSATSRAKAISWVRMMQVMPCSASSRMVTRRRPSMLERTCDGRFSQAGRDALRLGGRGAFLEDLGGRTYGGGSCPSYLSMMRSYFMPCWRSAGDMVRQPGAVRMTRGERAPHSGQADGRSHSAIGRNCVNGPHFLHIYSYVGIDHLHPGKRILRRTSPSRLWKLYQLTAGL